jgi:cyclopropane fatty-acyl-phospholipid synthase-like methyltransferase
MPSDGDILAALEASGEQYQFSSRAGSHQYLRLYELTRKYVPAGARVLDWGTASGHFAYFLARAGYEVTAYSLFEEQAPQGLDGAGYRLVIGDPADPVTLPFGQGSFDAVASIGVLEHVRETGGDEVDSLNEIRRILRPGGTFMCFHLPNRHSWIDHAARLVGAHHHTYRYTPSDIASIMEAASLRVVETERYAVLPRLPLSRLPNSLRWSERFARAYDRLDAFLGRVLPWICTNHYVVATVPMKP